MGDEKDLDDLLLDADSVADEELVEALRAKKARRDARRQEAAETTTVLREKSELLRETLKAQEEEEIRLAEQEKADQEDRMRRREANKAAREAQLAREEEEEVIRRQRKEADRLRKKEERMQKMAERKNAASQPSLAVPKDIASAVTGAKTAPSTPDQKKGESADVTSATTATPADASTEVMMSDGDLSRMEQTAMQGINRLLDGDGVDAQRVAKAIAADGEMEELMKPLEVDVPPVSIRLPETILDPEREAALDATEDAALFRLQQRALERQRKKSQRAADESVDPAERERLQQELARDRMAKLDELKKIDDSGATDEDRALMRKLERVLSTAGATVDKGDVDAAERRLRDEEHTAGLLADPNADIDALLDEKTLSRQSSQMNKKALLAVLADDGEDDDGSKFEAAMRQVSKREMEAHERETAPVVFKGIRVGIIGAGANATKRHIPLLQLEDGVKVTHVANRAAESSQQVADKFKIANVTTPEELLANPDVDAVLIGTWPYKHAEYTIAALKNGKHVLTEARMAMNGREAADMLAVSREHPELVAQVVPAPMSLELDTGIARYVKDHLGTLVFVRGAAFGNAFAAGKKGDSFAGLWRTQREFSGNNVLKVGILYEMLIRWVGRASTVSAMASSLDSVEGDLPNVVSMQGKLEKDGALFQLSFSDVTGLGGCTEVWLFGTTGTLHVDLDAMRVRFGKPLDDAMRDVTSDVRNESEGWNVEREFLDAIRGKGLVRKTDFETGAHTMSFTDAVWTSMESGKEASI